MLQIFAKSKTLITRYKALVKAQAFVSAENFAPYFLEAVICVEDRRFYRHCGIDLIGIFRAFVTNLINFKIVEGASTITQQLVRTTVLTNERTYKRKFQEIFLAIFLEIKLSKRQILEYYLNVCYFGSIGGNCIYGIKKASQSIFGKDPLDLSLAEVSFLAAMIGRPLAPTSSVDAYMRTFYRQRLILNHLKTKKIISESLFFQAEQENIEIFKQPKENFPLKTIDQYRRKYHRPRDLTKLIKNKLHAIGNSHRYNSIIFHKARKYDLPFEIVKRLIRVESSFNPNAISAKGAKGLMQIMDSTFEFIEKKYRLNLEKNIFEPSINIEIGTRFLKNLRDRYRLIAKEENVFHFVLAAYNAGPTTVNRAIDRLKEKEAPMNWPNLRELLPCATRRYVETILYPNNF